MSGAPDGGIAPDSFLRALFAALNARGLEYAVLRHHRGYPASMHKPDLGLLVSRRHLDRVAETVHEVTERLGYALHLNLARQSGLALVALEVLVERDEQPAFRVLKVDARAYLTLEPDVVGPERLLPRSARRVFYEDVERREVTREGCSFFALDGPAELTLLVQTFRRKRSEACRADALRALEEPEVEGWVRDVARLEPRVLRAALTERASPDRLDPLLARLVAARWGTPSLSRSIREVAAAGAVRLRRRWPARAPLVYFAGPDGCGKTTLVDAVSGFLTQRHVPHVKRYSIQRVLRFAGRRLAWAQYHALARWQDHERLGFRRWVQRREHRDRDDGRLAWRARKYLELWVGFLDVLLGAALVEVERRRGRTVLVETSPYDLFVKYHMPEFPRTEALLARWIPRPSLGLLLAADPQQIVARKADLSADEIAEYYTRLARVLERAGGADDFVEVETGEDPPRAAAQARREVLRRVGAAALRRAA